MRRPCTNLEINSFRLDAAAHLHPKPLAPPPPPGRCTTCTASSCWSSLSSSSSRWVAGGGAAWEGTAVVGACRLLPGFIGGGGGGGCCAAAAAAAVAAAAAEPPPASRVQVCVTIVGTYFLLNAENYHWHWTAFSAGASTCERLPSLGWLRRTAPRARCLGMRVAALPVQPRRTRQWRCSGAAPLWSECRVDAPIPNAACMCLLASPAAVYVMLYSIHYFVVSTPACLPAACLPARIRATLAFQVACAPCMQCAQAQSCTWSGSPARPVCKASTRHGYMQQHPLLH